MAISAISGVSASAGIQSAAGTDYADQIKQLQKQKEEIQQRITKLNQDKTLNTKQKEQQAAIYQAQIDALDARIQALEKRQAEAAQASGQLSAAQSRKANPAAIYGAQEAAPRESAAEDTGIDVQA